MRSSFKVGMIGTVLAIAAFAAGAAHADSVTVTTIASIGAPTQTPSASMNWAQTPTSNTLSIQVAGKTCTLVSSKQAGSSNGCNYALNVAPDGSITGILTAGNSACTPSAQVASSCQ